jgi:hypothetical protein
MCVVSCRVRVCRVFTNTDAGAAVNMRPDLFRAVIMGVPFLNPLAAMTNESLPLTIHEYDEWGTGPRSCLSPSRSHPPGPSPRF